ncbi:DNA-binding CsgD family transcriptional regulator [Streptomyces griseochromogenes]|uniref:DNA-binding CsgD family transcriptional regulator n=1 Tax=Streptomyces griseochromogenes TaxID=68214 RepID=A0ABS4M9J7_9ACTN|nr:helix-turn-helix transcriptional regulator [Streptomyces griseochromogenes]MBP2056351.1 DNA-binding CsgD family transcriptional regulator [Streptomyces griseochromogenes]
MAMNAADGLGVLAPVGREDEVRTVVQAARRAAAGQGGVVLVTGEAGIGKTTLVQAVLAQLRGLDMQVYSGTADVGEARWPFSAISDCLQVHRRSPDPRRARLAGQIHPEPGSQPGAAGDDVALVQQVIALVEEACEQGSLALVLDDAQWADPQSVMCLQRIGRLARQLPLLMLGAIRSGPGTPQLDVLLESWHKRGATLIALEPLEEPQVEELLANLAGASAGPGLRRLAADAAGNPFYLTALVEALTAAKALSVDGSQAETTLASGPHSLHEAITQRLRFLPGQVVEALRAAALLGSRFSVSELAAATGTPPHELVACLEQAEQAGVLTEAHDQLAFRHDLVRQALEETMSVSARQAMHTRLGLALAAAGYPAERVADQLRRSPTAPGHAGLDWLDGAAGHLVVRNRDTALELFERILPTTDPADARVQRLNVLWAETLFAQGRTDQCHKVAGWALGHCQDPGLRTRLRWTLARHAAADEELAKAGVGLRLAEQAADHPDTTPAQRLQFLTFRALLLCRELGEFEQAAQLAEQVRCQAAELGEQTVLLQASEALALTELCRNRPSSVLALLEQIPHGWRFADTFRAGALVELGRLPEAVAAVRQRSVWLAEPECAGDVLWRHLAAAYVQFVGGWWDDARAEVEAGQELPEHADAHRGLHGVGALIALHRDNAAAGTYLESAPVRDPYRPADRFTGSLARWAHAVHAQYHGCTERALQLFEHLCHNDARSLWPLWLAGPAPEAVRLALEAGERDRALSIQALVLEQAGQTEPGLLEATVLACQGLLEQDVDALRAAAGHCEALSRPWDQARCLEDAAAVLTRRGHRDDACRQLRHAATGYQQLEAAWDLARVNAALRTLGVRQGVRGPRGRPSHGWEALTATERKVADLIAQGLSNPHIAERLFISRRTVQTHVSHILAKLGMNSRVEVAALAAQHTGQ